jgi:putative ABC transport system ATP-binding protein
VAVARALATSPRLILADEPTGNLDHVAGRAVIDALIEITDATGAALVVSTHDPEFAARLAIRWEMTDGRLRTDGYPRQHRSTREEPCSA